MTLASFFNLSIYKIEKLLRTRTFEDFRGVGGIYGHNSNLANLLDLHGFDNYWQKQKVIKKANPHRVHGINHSWTDTNYSLNFYFYDNQAKVISIIVSRRSWGCVLDIRINHLYSTVRNPSVGVIDKNKCLYDFLIFDGSDNE